MLGRRQRRSIAAPFFFFWSLSVGAWNLTWNLEVRLARGHSSSIPSSSCPSHVARSLARSLFGFFSLSHRLLLHRGWRWWRWSRRVTTHLGQTKAIFGSTCIHTNARKGEREKGEKNIWGTGSNGQQRHTATTKE